MLEKEDKMGKQTFLLNTLHPTLCKMGETSFYTTVGTTTRRGPTWTDADGSCR